MDSSRSTDGPAERPSRRAAPESATAPGTGAMFPAGVDFLPAGRGVSASPGDRLGAPILRRSEVVALSGMVGNRVVAAALTRRAPVQRLFGSGKTEREKIDAALAATVPDAALVKAIDKYGEAKPQERIKLARILVYHNELFFGPRDRAALTGIFEAFGDDIAAIAKLDPLLLQDCMKRYPRLMFGMKPFEEAAKKAKAKIRAEAMANLDKNITYLEDERKRMFGEERGKPEDKLKDSEEQNKRANAMVGVAGELLRLRRSQNKMLATPVGFKYEGGTAQPIKFKPGHAPGVKGAGYYNTYDKYASYAAVLEQWNLAAKETGWNVQQFPWLLGLLKDPENAEARLEKLTKTDGPYEARVQIMVEMQNQITFAKGVKTGYEAKEPDWADFVPIRKKIREAATDPLEMCVIDGIVQGEEDLNWYKKVGFETLVAAALVVATIATAGAAPLIAGVVAGAVAVGVPAAQAYTAYEKSKELGEANRATVLSGTELTTEMQAAAAKAEAVAHAIEAVVNLLFVGHDVGVALKFEIRLAKFAELATGEQGKVLAEAVQKFGPVGASKRTGLTMAELIGRVGPESEAATAIKKQMAELSAKPFGELTAEQQVAMRFAGAGRSAPLDLAAMNGPERVAAVIKAIDEQGVAGAVRSSGRTPEELLAIVGKDSSAGERITAYMDLTKGGVGAAMDTLSGKLAKLSTLDKTEANKVVLEAIELAGPARAVQQCGGWVAVEAALGGGGTAMSRLRTWREGVFAELLKFMEQREAPSAAAEAGTRSAAEIEAEKNFLANSTGVPAAEVEKVIGETLANPDFMRKHGLEMLAAKKLFENSMPLSVRKAKILEILNARLKDAGVPPIKKLTTVKAKGGAHFDMNVWEAQFDETVLSAAKVGEGDWRFLVSGIYHEARHAEQVFMAARAKAGETGSMEILTKSLSDGGMRLPPDIAQAAFEKRIAKGQPGFEEGIGWFETFWGKEKKWREGVLQSKDKLKKELDILERSIDDMKAQIKEAKANGEKFPVDLEMRLDKLEADADKLDKQLGEYHKMYRDLKEERDAYRIGDAANAEYSRLVREQELIRKEMAAEPGPITKRPAALGPVAPPGAPVETK